MKKPNILLIDDESSERSQRLLAEALKPLANVEVVAPEEVAKGMLSRADLVLLDFNLGKWAELEDVPIARRPVNGLALSSVLRAHLGDKGLKSSRATAFALRSGFLADLVGDAAGSRAVHLLARLNNLEWVFSKGAAGAPEQIVSLANAVGRLRLKWRRRDHSYRAAMEDLLGFPDQSWAATAREDVDACRPPIHDISGPTHGIPLLRWLLHRVLPYPCFLWSETRLANRLRLTEQKLGQVLTRRNDFAKRLRGARYTGILADFAGARWWASGVEAALWALTDGNPHDPVRLAKLAQQPEPKGEIELDSVLCIDAEYQLIADVIPSRLAVRVMPDDWPPFAEQPWASFELLKEAPHMRAIANKADLPRLKVKP